jgi:hypothetical protein
VDEADRIDVGAEIAVMRNGGCRDLDLSRDVIQREETVKGGPEVLAQVQPEDKDLMGWAEVGNVVSSDVVPEPCKTTMVTCVDSQDVTEGGRATRSRKPELIMSWWLTVASGGHSSL